MDIKSIGSYGGPFADAKVVRDPTTQCAADFYNRLAEDAAQMTRTSPKALVKFTLINSAGSVSVSAGNVRTQWGTGASYAPTVVRGATAGLYTVTFSSSYADGLSESETVSFFCAKASIQSSTVADAGHVQCQVSANVITLQVVDMAGVAADFTGKTLLLEVF